MGKKRILVTSALPYANGSLHLGHLVEYIQTDVWVRHNKMKGENCRYMCADDTHGTPVMISAGKAGVSPEEFISKIHKQRIEDFGNFLVEFDNYYTTHSEENREQCELIFKTMREKGHVDEREISQMYCEKDRMFLPDRFIKGKCPKCGAEDQYGDSCEKCGATYNPDDLVDPYCSVCGEKPVLRNTTHYFFRLNDFREQLGEWFKGGHVQQEVLKKLDDWFKEGLRDWDISRDEPYFGFKIPGSDDKFFYVWLDAPVGYMASTKNWCARNGEDFDLWWKSPDTEIYHFIGKDIVYFHCLFWPAMLMCSGYSTPKKVFVHGFLTVNGEKMSKSRGTFIKASTFARHVNPEFLRYYYSCKLSGTLSDIDLNFDDFRAKVNSDIVGKIANLGVRSSAILAKSLDSRTGTMLPEDQGFIGEIKGAKDDIVAFYDNLEYSKAMREICRLSDVANKFVEDSAPWTLAKTDPERARAKLTAILEAFRILVLYLKPVMPRLAETAEENLRSGSMTWGDIDSSVENRELGKMPHLAKRIEIEQIEKMTAETIAENAHEEKERAAEEAPVEPLAPECTIEDFSKIDLRVGTVKLAEHVEGASKLLHVVVDIGGGVEKNIFAGIKSAYSPEDLVGRQIVIVANLKPRKMKFGVSEGMVVAAGEGGKYIFVLHPDEGAKNGDRIH